MSAIIFWVLFGGVALGFIVVIISIGVAIYRTVRESKAAAKPPPARARIVSDGLQNEQVGSQEVTGEQGSAMPEEGSATQGSTDAASTVPAEPLGSSSVPAVKVSAAVMSGVAPPVPRVGEPASLVMSKKG